MHRALTQFWLIMTGLGCVLSLVSCGDPKVELRLYGIDVSGQQVQRDEAKAVKATYDLLRQEIPRDYSDEFGNTLLHQAAAMNHTYVGGVLIFNRFDVDARNNAGMTPLHLAAYLGQLDFVHLVLSNDADPFLLDTEGKRPIDRAIERMDQLEQSHQKAVQARLIGAIQSKMQREMIKRAKMKGLEINQDER